MKTVTAGRELDLLIADKVMGQRICFVDCAYEDDDHETPINNVLHYSTDIAAAWLVMEKMRELGFKKRELWSEYHGIWLAEFDRYQSGNSEMEPSEAPTAPLAICLAALNAIGHEVPA